MCLPGPGGVGCRYIGSPLDFAIGAGGAIDLSQFGGDDAKLRDALRVGKEKRGKVVALDQMFGDVTPSPLNQNMVSGENLIESATAALFSANYLKMSDKYDRNELNELLEEMQEWAEEFNGKTKKVNFYLWTTFGLMESFREDIGGDLVLI